jgi:type I restriction enzyme S subunit
MGGKSPWCNLWRYKRKANAQDHIENGNYPLFDRSEVIKASNEFIFDCEVVIIPGEGMRFIPKYFEGKFNLHQRAYALKDFTCSGHFVYYSILHRSALLSQKAVKSTVLSLRLPILQDFPIDIPKSKEEQNKIASCFSTLDVVIAAHSQKLDTLKDYKKGLIQSLFPQEDETVPKYRFPEFVKDNRWRKITVGEIAKVSAGGTPDSTNPEYWNGNIPWMNSGELNNKRIYSVSNFITSKGLKESSTKLIPPKCVLIGLAGQGKTRGTAAINYIELCTNQSIGSIYPNEDVFDSEFLYQRIDSIYEKLRYLSAGDGGRGGLNLQIIKEVELLLPKMEGTAKNSRLSFFT